MPLKKLERASLPNSPKWPRIPVHVIGGLFDASAAKRIAWIAACTAIPVYYALRGGSFDVVVYTQEAVMIWWALALGIGFGLFPRILPPRAAAPALVGAIALSAWTAASLGWSDSAERTYEELARVLHYLGLLLLVWLLVTKDTWRMATFGLALGAAAVCALSVGSRLVPNAFPEDHVRQVFPREGYRLNYPFHYTNAVGAWAAMSAGLLLGISAHLRSVAGRMMAISVIPICVAAGYLTYSRASVVGVGVAVVALFILANHRWLVLLHTLVAGAAGAAVVVAIRGNQAIADGTGPVGAEAVSRVLVLGMLFCALAALAFFWLELDKARLPRRVGRAGAGATITAVVLLSAVIGPGLLDKGWEQFTSPSSVRSDDPAARLSTISGDRHNQWQSAFDAITAHPVIGTGAGTFEFWWDRGGGVRAVRDAHSLYFETVAEIGIVGGMALLLLLGGLAFNALRARWKAVDPEDAGLIAALIATAIVFLFHASLDWMWEVPALVVLGIGALALAASGMTTSSDDGRPGRHVGVRLSLSAAALALMLMQLPPLISTSELRRSRDAAISGRPASALTNANEAVAAQPWAASPYVQRSLLAESQGLLTAAESDAGEAVTREPHNWRHRLLQAQILAEKGDVRGAVRAYRQAKRLRPSSRFFEPE